MIWGIKEPIKWFLGGVACDKTQEAESKSIYCDFKIISFWLMEKKIILKDRKKTIFQLMIKGSLFRDNE